MLMDWGEARGDSQAAGPAPETGWSAFHASLHGGGIPWLAGKDKRAVRKLGRNGIHVEIPK
jgi:hypothetical protein